MVALLSANLVPMALSVKLVKGHAPYAMQASVLTKIPPSVSLALKDFTTVKLVVLALDAPPSQSQAMIKLTARLKTLLLRRNKESMNHGDWTLKHFADSSLVRSASNLRSTVPSRR